MSKRALLLVLIASVVTSAWASYLTAGSADPASIRQSQPAVPTGTALIIGRVVDGTTGAAVTGVAVTIGGSNALRAGNAVLVDTQGRFIFSGLAAGSFTLMAEKNGYFAGTYGRTRPGGQSQPIVLRDGERVTDATMHIWRYGTISGAVVDDAGEPVSGAQVIAFQRTWVAGHPSLSTSGGPLTDDRGMFRIIQLPPGEYVVCVTSRLVTFPMSFVEADNTNDQATDIAQRARSVELAAKGSERLGTYPAAPSSRLGDFVIARAPGPATPLPSGNERLSIFPITFYPSARATELTTPISLAPGEQRSGIDLHVRLTPTVRVSGTASGSTGPIGNLGVHLQLGVGNQFRSRMLVEPAQTVTAPDGAFTFLGVPAGSYVVVAATTSPAGDGASAALPVTVGDRDLTDVPLTLRPNPRVSGRIEFDGTSARPELRMLSALIGLDPVDGHFERQTFQIDASGNLPGRAVLPGRYFVHVDLNAVQGAASRVGTWTLKSAMVDGRDVSDVPLTVETADITGLVITLTDHPATLAGTVRTTQGAADTTATVLVFPADKAMWVDYGALPRRLRSVRADRSGAFSVSALPAGEYFAIALPDEFTGDWQRQTSLEKAAALATRVRIQDGTTAALDLVTRRW